jgi:hypothetical protein
MGLEIAEFIHELNEEWPTPEGWRREGDDHFRLIKGAIKRTFPNVEGEVTLSHTQLNSLLQYVADVEGGLISTLSLFPAGGIILWSGTINAIPTGWTLCNGENGTPDLRDRFVVGAAGTLTVGATGGVAGNTVSLPHTHTVTVESHALTTNQIPAHSHNSWIRAGFERMGSFATGLVAPGSTAGQTPEGEGIPSGPSPDTELNSTATTTPAVSTTGGGGGHSHGASAGTATPTQSLENRPPYFALAYIMKLASTPPTPVPPPA